MAARASDFRLYHSNALDGLAALLAEELRAPAPGQPLLAPDTILIPQVAMRRWLQATLAERHGIAANLEFLTRSEEHTSELQSLMRISYAVFCLKKKFLHTKIRLNHTYIKYPHQSHITKLTNNNTNLQHKRST